MTLTAERQAELLDLIDGVCTATITDEQNARLEAFLLHDADAQWFYLQHVHLHGSLLWNEQSQSEWNTVKQMKQRGLAPAGVEKTDQVESPRIASIPQVWMESPGGSSFISSGWPVAYLIATAVVGIGLALAAITQVSEPTSIVQDATSARPRSSLSIPSPKTEIVGRITGMVDCQWEEAARGRGAEESGQTNLKSKIRNLKSPVFLGDRLALRSGLLEITYNSGAKVILQGPVTYEVESAAGGYLLVGRLTAKLEKKEEQTVSRSSLLAASSLFVVRTPTAVVTDLGTEFGVEVRKDGSTVSHVFRGSVEVRGTSDAVRANQAVCVLLAGESAQVMTPVKPMESSTTEIQRVRVDAGQFVRQLSPKSVQKSVLPMQVVAWFRLGEDDPDAVVGSKVKSKTMNHNGRYHLSPRTQPTYSGNAAPVGSSMSVYFDGADDECLVSSRVPYAMTEEFILEAWVRPRKISKRYHHIAYNGNPSGNGYGLLIGDGHWQYLFGDVKTIDSGVPCELGVWTHLALVYERDRSQLWVNGKPVGTPSTEWPKMPDLSFSIGCDHTALPSLAFNGEIDEVRLSKLLGPFCPEMLLFRSSPPKREKGDGGK